MQTHTSLIYQTRLTSLSEDSLPVMDAFKTFQDQFFVFYIMELGQEGECEKVPLKVVERRLQDFTRVTLPLDLARLRTHKSNILQFQSASNWEKLHSEQINASRTVQQLKGHIEALEGLGSQVCVDDLPQFNSRVQGVKEDILSAIADYITVQTKVESDDRVDVEFEELTVDEQSSLIPREEEAAASWEELRAELVDLSEIVRVLASEVKNQGSLVDRIEENVDAAAEHVQTGENEIRVASRFNVKLYLLPVGGALVGGVVGGAVGGPLGALVGLKAGLTAAAAGTAGAIGGAYVGYKGRKEFLRDQAITTKKKQ